MTLRKYQQIYGPAGLERLAIAAGTSRNYLWRLICSPTRLPSASLALQLIRASGGELTLEGLAYPTGGVRRDHVKGSLPKVSCAMCLRLIELSGGTLTLEQIVDAITERA